MNMSGLVDLGMFGGSFKIEEDSNEGSFISCVTDGFFSFPQSNAYGTWEAQCYLHDRMYLSFISQTTERYLTSTGYNLCLDNSGPGGTWVLRRYTGGAVVTICVGSGDLNINQWNSIKITRDLSGEFKVYINSNLVGTGTNIDHVISNFAVIDMDAGDRIRNFKHSLGVIQ